jgi:uncharacterized membrane protein YvbJ
MEKKIKNLHKAITQRPREEMDLVLLASRVNNIKDSNKINLLLAVLRADPNYSERFFNQTDHGIEFELKDLSIVQIHIIYHMAKTLCG